MTLLDLKMGFICLPHQSVHDDFMFVSITGLVIIQAAWQTTIACCFQGIDLVSIQRYNHNKANISVSSHRDMFGEEKYYQLQSPSISKHTKD